MIEQKATDKINEILPHLSERQRRLYLAGEAAALGYGGQKEICETFHISPVTLRKGLKELQSGEVLTDDKGSRRDRTAGGGRKPLAESQPGILQAMEKLVNPETFGNPENPLRRTTRSVRNIAEALQEEGFEVHYTSVPGLLKTARIFAAR